MWSLTLAPSPMTLREIPISLQIGGASREARERIATWPRLVGGPGRDVTLFMEGVPGLLAKDGAEGVYAAAMAEESGINVPVPVLDQ